MSPDESPTYPPARLSSEELERVIRRAADLQTAREGLPDELDDEAVVQIGAEVGLHEQHVRRALLEIRAEAMIPVTPDDRSVPHRLWGAAFVQASRVVPGTVDEVQDRLDDYLHSAESLRQVRGRSGVSVWEPASDLVSQLRRGLNLSGHGFMLAKARRIEVAIEPVETGRCLVNVSADLRNQRAEHGGGGMFGAVAATTGVTLSLVLAAGFPVALVLPLAAGTAFSGGTLIARRTLRSAREKVELAVQGLLDRLERGGPIAGGRSGLMDRIQGLITEGDR